MNIFLNNQKTNDILPFNGFYGDDFLTMLWQHKTETSSSSVLIDLKEQLNIVANKKASKAQRAKAAINIGKHVSGSNTPLLRRRSQGESSPFDWYQLALDLGNPTAAWLMSRLLLEEKNASIEINLNDCPVPILHSKKTRFGRPVSETIINTWQKGILVSLRSRQRKFVDWDQDMYEHAIACICCYLSISQNNGYKKDNEIILTRIQEIIWIKPLWNAMINAEVNNLKYTDEHKWLRIDQQLAIFAALDEDIESNSDNLFNVNSTSANTEDKNKTLRKRIIKGNITPANDISDAESLKRFEILKRPLKLVGLPEINHLNKVKTTLNDEFPWAFEVIDEIMNHLITKKLYGVLPLSMDPILLVGTPGTGKTRLCNRLAELLGTVSCVINMAGMADPKLLKGSARGWASARPSKIIEQLAENKIANPLFILDEVDKVVSYSHYGDPNAVLIDLLEPTNSKNYHDLFLLTECDLTSCMYIATCNSLQDLSEPLLSRFKLIYFPKPGAEHTKTIAINVLRDLEKQWALPENVMALSDYQLKSLEGLTPREIRFAVNKLISDDNMRPIHH